MKIHRFVLPSPQKGGPANVYLVENGDLTLIDTGPNYQATWNKLDEELRSLGLRIEDIGKIIITHAHTDHCGMARSIKQVSQARIYGHPITATYLIDPDRELCEYYYGRVTNFLRRVGTPEEVIAAASPGVDILRELSQPASVDEVLDEGDMINIGGSDWEVMNTPGHSPSAICLFNPESRQMFCGDQLLLNVPPNPLIEPPNSNSEDRPHTLSMYLKSLQRLAAMEISICFSGHGDPISDHRTVIEQRHKRHNRRKQLILDVLDGCPKTPYEITRAVTSPTDDGFDVFLGISDVIGHLDLLEEEGKVHQVEADGIIHYESCLENVAR